MENQIRIRARYQYSKTEVEYYGSIIRKQILGAFSKNYFDEVLNVISERMSEQLNKVVVAADLTPLLIKEEVLTLERIYEFRYRNEHQVMAVLKTDFKIEEDYCFEDVNGHRTFMINSFVTIL